MKTKVCHLSSAHPQKDPRIFYKQCTSLAKAGYETYLVAQGQTKQENGVELIGLPAMGTGRLQRMLFGARAAYKAGLALDAALYELHDPELLPYGRKLKRLGKRVIFDSHEDYPSQILEKEWIPKPFRKLVSVLYKGYETKMVKEFDAVLFPCTKNGENIFEGRAKETVILSNAVLLSETSLPEQTSLKKDIKDIKRTICCTGSLSKNRGITQLVLAAEKAGVRLILAGNYASAAYKAELQALPEYRCVEDRGYLGREELGKVYAESEIGMSTILNIGQYSSLDNFPTKVYEYMAAGLPVIVSDYPFLRKAVEEGGFGVAVNPEDTQAISAAILALLADPEKAKQMGEAGRKAVLEKYHWGIEEKKLLELYHKLLPHAEVTAP